MQIICYKQIQGQTVLAKITTVVADPGYLIRQLVGVGKPYWAWPSVPVGKVIGADFTNAPIASANIAENNAAYQNIINNGPTPEDVLVYEVVE